MEKNIRNKRLNKKYNLLITAIPFIPIIKRFEKKIKKRGINYTLLKSRQQVSEKQFFKIIHKYDAILSGDDEITKKVIDKAINLKVISKWGTGIDSIEHEYAKKKGIKVFNTPGAFTNGVATMAISMILAFYRKIIINHNDIRKNIWSKYSGETILNKKVGLIGVGRIGKKIIEMLQGFKTINYINDTKKINQKFLSKFKLKHKTKKFIFKNCDIIIIATDLNKTSFKIINRKTINFFKKKPLLVNIGRGGSIDNQALLKSLKQKKIKGACLDVFETEPLSKNNLLKKLDNCILTSHNAFNTKDEVEFVNKNTLNNIFKGLNVNAENIKKIQE